MYQLISPLLKAIRRIRFANSPVLLVALSFSLAAAYGTAPRKAPAASSATHGQQQLTTSQAQPTSSDVEASESPSSSEANTSPEPEPKNEPDTSTEEKLFEPTISEIQNEGITGTPWTVAVPPDGCNSNCAPPTPFAPRCGSCQPSGHYTDAAYRCALVPCTD